MNTDNKKNSSANGKNKGGKFNSKNIKHDPQAESARTKFGLNDNTKNSNE